MLYDFVIVFIEEMDVWPEFLLPVPQTDKAET